jgi:hypothetical protein
MKEEEPRDWIGKDTRGRVLFCCLGWKFVCLFVNLGMHWMFLVHSVVPTVHSTIPAHYYFFVGKKNGGGTRLTIRIYILGCRWPSTTTTTVGRERGPSGRKWYVLVSWVPPPPNERTNELDVFFVESRRPHNKTGIPSFRDS